MRNIQWEAETDLGTIYVGSSNLHYPMPPLTCLVLCSRWCCFSTVRLAVWWCWCWLHWWSAWPACGQSVDHLMNCHRSGEDLGRSRSYLILWTQPRASPLRMIGMTTEKMVMIRATQGEYETLNHFLNSQAFIEQEFFIH